MRILNKYLFYITIFTFILKPDISFSDCPRLLTNINDSLLLSLKHTQFPLMQPNHPFSLHLLKIPFSTSEIAKDRLNFSYSAGNTWKPTMYMIDRGFGSYRQIIQQINEATSIPVGKLLCEECEEYELPSIPAFNQAKIYRADGVIRRFHFAFSMSINTQNEIGINFNIFKLVGGSSFVDFAVSDNLIEYFHKKLTSSKSDPFNRQLREYNQAGIKFIDKSQNIQIKNNDFFFGTIDLSYKRFFKIIETHNILLTANWGFAIGLPLNQLNNYLSFATFGTVSNTFRLLGKNTLTAAIGYGYNFNRLVKVGRTMQFFDNKNQYTYTLILGINNIKKSRMISYGIEFLGESPFMKRSDYTVFYETIGEDSSTKTLGGKNTWLLTTHNQYLGFFFSHTNRKWQPNSFIKSITKGLKIIEDGNFERSKVFALEGAVAQDLAIEFFLSLGF
jgi:hypothetical protein